LEILESKKNIRLLTLDFSKSKDAEKHEYIYVMVGLLTTKAWGQQQVLPGKLMVRSSTAKFKN